jgi:hypothetical protein
MSQNIPGLHDFLALSALAGDRTAARADEQGQDCGPVGAGSPGACRRIRASRSAEWDRSAPAPVLRLTPRDERLPGA